MSTIATVSTQPDRKFRRRSLTDTLSINFHTESIMVPEGTFIRLQTRSHSATLQKDEHHHHPSCLKKQPTGISAFLSHVVDRTHLKAARLPWTHPEDTDDEEQIMNQEEEVEEKQVKRRHVHFPKTSSALQQEIECTNPTTEEEKAMYHYSREELRDLIADGKDALLRESRFQHQSEETIYQQGYLTFPKETHFFTQKRLYCLLKARQFVCYSSAAHAAKNIHIKHSFAIIKVEDCSTMSMHTKIQMFGAHLPLNLSRMFLVSQLNGDQILLSAENRHVKKNWIHALIRLTEIREVLDVPPKRFPLPPLCLRQVSSSSTTSCSSDEEDGKNEQPEILMENVDVVITQLAIQDYNNVNT